MCTFDIEPHVCKELNGAGHAHRLNADRCILRHNMCISSSGGDNPMHPPNQNYRYRCLDSQS